ncbi:MAG TPA: hypothetical protein VGR26_12560 [Acidimicrobiales bacterium]|nr:hypothetical protein [Acidimicrobiales bacterium]
METSVNAIVVFTLVYLVVPGAVVRRAFRFPRQGHLAEWARTYGLELTDDNRPAVIGYLRTTRRFRAVGGAGGWFIGGLPLLIGQPLPLDIDGLALALAGFFGGAALAELRFSRRGAGPTPRRASLVPREMDDYVAPWVRRVSWAAVALAVALLGVYAALDRVGDGGRPAIEVLPGVLGAATVVAVATWAQRRLVNRPQPLSAPDLVAADDALRASSAATAAGAGLISALLALSNVLSSILLATRAWPVRWLILVAGLGILALIVASLVSVFHPGPWWFGRRHSQRAAA